MSDRIDQLASQAREHIPTLLLGMRDRIEAAVTDAVEASQENDSKAIFRIPISIAWDLDSTEARFSVCVSTRSKAEVTVSLDDPAQSKLPLEASHE